MHTGKVSVFSIMFWRDRREDSFKQGVLDCQEDQVAFMEDSMKTSSRHSGKHVQKGPWLVARASGVKSSSYLYGGAS